MQSWSTWVWSLLLHYTPLKICQDLPPVLYEPVTYKPPCPVTAPIPLQRYLQYQSAGWTSSKIHHFRIHSHSTRPSPSHISLCRWYLSWWGQFEGSSWCNCDQLEFDPSLCSHQSYHLWNHGIVVEYLMTINLLRNLPGLSTRDWLCWV